MRVPSLFGNSKTLPLVHAQPQSEGSLIGGRSSRSRTLERGGFLGSRHATSHLKIYLNFGAILGEVMALLHVEHGK